MLLSGYNVKKAFLKGLGMKKLLKALWSVLCDTSVLFILTVMFFALFIFDTNTAHFTKDTLVSFFLFSLVFGLAGVVHTAVSLPSFLRHFIRLVLTSVGFAIFILTSAERSEMQMFVGTVVFVLCYLVVFALSRLVLLPFKKKETDITE